MGCWQLAKRGVDQGHAVPETLEPLPREREGEGVAVATEQSSAGFAVQQRFGVSAVAERRVEIETGTAAEPRQGFLNEHRLMTRSQRPGPPRSPAAPRRKAKR